MSDIQLINADCLDYMKTMPDKGVDAIICDLPYEVTANSWDTIIPFEPLWKQYKRIIKDNGAIVLTASQPFTSKLIMSNLKWFKYEWIWDKTIHGNFLLAKYQPLKIHENICVFGKDKINYNPVMRKGRLRQTGGSKSKLWDMKMQKKWNENYYPQSIVSFSNAKRGIHPTQKPVALFEYLIKTYTNEGDLVLDNCAGSGTLGIAAYNTNRRAILIEKDPEYYQIAKKRIKDAQKQQRLFVPQPTKSLE